MKVLYKQTNSHTDKQTNEKNGQTMSNETNETNEKAAAEKKAGGPKLIGESYGDWKKKAAAAVKRVAGKKEERKAQKATDAGARAKRMLQRKVHAKYVSGSEDLVPDEMRD